jgi:formylglycine-generating enzyme required for sulfatase activity
VEQARLSTLAGELEAKAPIIVLPIDQGEELFVTEGSEEAQELLDILRELLVNDITPVLVLVTMRSDSYERLQTVKALDGIHQEMLGLPPMPRGAYQAVIEGPAERLRDSSRALMIDPALTQALLADIESGGGRDALPLLAFTIERLYLEYRGRGRLMLADYEALGRIKGSIEAAVERALGGADADPNIPRDRAARLLLLRRGLIPWLAGIDPETGNPRRRIARLSEIPVEARPLIQCLVEQRLLATDVAQGTGEVTIEPAHEALLRQWGILQGWLAEDAGLLGVLEGVKRAARDWATNKKDSAWLTHATGRLAAAERLRDRADLAASLEPTDWEYLAECRKRDVSERTQRERLLRRTRQMASVVGVLILGIGAGLAWSNRDYLKVRAVMLAEMVWPRVLTADAEHALKPGEGFKECADCPEMVVVPAGEFMMGSPATEAGRRDSESPLHQVTIATVFAISRFEVTFDEWDACVLLGGCAYQTSDQGWGRGRRPAINVSWDDARQYVAWLSKRTGKPYRLLSEAEWEYAARAGSDKAYSWGDEIGKGNANCADCGSPWDAKQTAPVGSFAPNAFGLYDMHGNVWEWVQDCYHRDYDGAPPDGSVSIGGDCGDRFVRGGSWNSNPQELRAAYRGRDVIDDRSYYLGIRVGRTLFAKGGAITLMPDER